MSSLPVGERREAAERLAEGDRVLLGEVLSLLDHLDPQDSSAGSGFDSLVAGAIGWLEAPEPSAVGRRFGAYRVLEELGRGGLGTVFLVERNDPGFSLRAALKVVHHARSSRLDQARFEQERQILASLSHPHIARVFDAGATEDGTPFFVMEAIEGEAIDRFCDRHRMDLRRRIELFLKVCEAVGYAHRNLVIHRDLKPSNILVTEDGVPKLLDFGIAKILADQPAAAEVDGRATVAPPTSESGPLTRTGELLLTPEYASPEQIGAAPLTTATDTYSLGVLLYHLLSGRQPYRFESYRPTEIERVLVTVTPRPLSAVQAEAGSPTPDAIADRRGLSASRLRRVLHGDLERIIAKALRKEPERRYVSVEAFAADLSRYLEGRPVEARGESWVYLGRKFVARHRLGVVAAGLIVLTFAAGLVATFTQMQRARLEQQRTAQVADFMVSLFESVDPDVARGEQTTTRELLDRGARDLLRERSLERSPQVRATLMTTVGRVYRQLAAYQPAEELLQRALELRQQATPDDDQRIAASMTELGQLYEAWQDDQRAREYLDDALRRQTATLPLDHPDRARTLYRLASLEITLDRYDEAEALLAESLAIRRKVFGERSEAVAEVRHAGAQVLYRTGRLAEAESELEEVLALRIQLLGDDHPLVLTAINDLASVLHDNGRYAEALSLLERTAHLRQEILGADHPFVARALLNLATVARKTGDLGLARSSLERALAIYRGDSGDRVGEAAVLSQLASVHQAEGDLIRAEELYRQALELRRQQLGPDHLDVARSVQRLAGLAWRRGDLVGAEALYRESLRIQQTVLGADDPTAAFSLIPLGRLLIDDQRSAEAEPLLLRALNLRRRTLPLGHWRIHEAEATLALSRVARGDARANRDRLDAGLGELEAALGADNPIVASLRAAAAKLPTARAQHR